MVKYIAVNRKRYMEKNYNKKEELLEQLKALLEDDDPALAYSKAKGLSKKWGKVREEEESLIIEENKEEQILYNISQNNKISSKKGNNNVKNITKDNIIQDNDIIRIIETDIISQNKENNKKDIINSEEKGKEKIKNYINENINEDDINKQINEKKEIKDNKKIQEGKDLKLIKGKGQNNIENKKMNKPKENGLNDSINKYFQNSQFKEINLNNPKLQIQKQYTFEFQKQNINSRNIEKGNNKIFENIKYEIEEIKLQNHKMNYEIAEIINLTFVPLQVGSPITRIVPIILYAAAITYFC
jgi:hypothetical protein